MLGFYESLGFALTIHATAMLVPGQNHFLLISVSYLNVVTRCLTVLGIASAGIVFSTGASAAIYFSGQATSDRIFSILGLMGSFYLLYLGVTGVRLGLINNQSLNATQASVNLSPIKSFAIGFLVNLSNPKSALFFGSIFASTLPMVAMSLSNHIFVVFMFFLNSVLTHGLISIFLSTETMRIIINEKQNTVSLVSGCMFIIFSMASITRILLQ